MERILEACRVFLIVVMVLVTLLITFWAGFLVAEELYLFEETESVILCERITYGSQG